MTPSIKTIAAKIAERLKKHPEEWTQGAIARDCQGSELDTYESAFLGAACYCLEGHITVRMKRMGATFFQVTDAIHDFRERAGIESDLYQWNDAPETTIADVIALCERVAGIDPTPCPQCHEAGEHKVGCERGTEP